MVDDTRIERFDVPTFEQLKALDVDEETANKIRAILAGEVDPCEVSPKCAAWVRSCYHEPDRDGHEVKLAAIDELLETSGVEALTIEDASSYTDEGIRHCPPFSYCNAGDPYVVTLLRDHQASAWVIACWADVLEEYEREEKLADYAEYDDCPERCPECHGHTFKLQHFAGKVQDSSYAWVCDSCGHHCLAVADFVPVEDDSDDDTEEGMTSEG